LPLNYFNFAHGFTKQNKLYENLFYRLRLILSSFAALAQVRTPSPSPAGSVSTVVGLTDVKIDYSRPRIKGRKILARSRICYTI